MDWKKTANSTDFLCFESKSKALFSRIESRKTDEGWKVYRSHYTSAGINCTDEFAAPTEDKMRQLVQTLQSEKRPTLAQIRQRILDKNKRVSINVEREFKEYSVEKWRFAVNNDAKMNFVLVRCCDDIDMDFVMHESYRSQEQVIMQEVIRILGFEGLESTINATSFFFSQHSVKQLSTDADELLDFSL